MIKSKVIVLFVVILGIFFTHTASANTDIWADGVSVKICPADNGYTVNTHNQQASKVEVYQKAQKVSGPIYVAWTTYSKVNVVCTGKTIEIYIYDKPAFVVIRDNLPKF